MLVGYDNASHLESIQECSLLFGNRCLIVVLLRIDHAPRFVQITNSVKVPLEDIQFLKMYKQNWMLSAKVWELNNGSL